jgi:hypothetical protein
MLQLCKIFVTFIYIKLQNQETRMYTTIDEQGRLNNYAKEPTLYLAEYPLPQQQQLYLFQGAVALLFVSLTLMTAFAVS